MPYTLNLTTLAIEDIQSSLDYYNNCSPGLGFRFTEEIDNSINAIVKMPKAYSYRYKNVRAKHLYKFPYLIFFIIDDNQQTIEVLRIFNDTQDAYWLKDKK